MICRDCKHIFYDDIDGERYCRYQGEWVDLVEWDVSSPDWCPINTQNRLIGGQNGGQNENQSHGMIEK